MMCATQGQRCYLLILRMNPTSQIIWVSKNGERINLCFSRIPLSKSVISRSWSVMFGPMVGVFSPFFYLFILLFFCFCPPVQSKHKLFLLLSLRIKKQEEWDLNDLFGGAMKRHACPHWWGMSENCALRWILLLIFQRGWSPSAIRPDCWHTVHWSNDVF